MARWPKLITRFRDALKAFREGISSYSVDPDDYLYRKLGSKTDHDLTPIEHEKHQKIAKYLYDTNPVCKRMVNMQAEYVVGEGWKVQSEDKELEDLLLKFWHNPVHDLDRNLIEFVKELAIFGEQCYRMFVNQYNGACEIGYIDPTLIASVKLAENPLLVDTVFIRTPGSTEPMPLEGVKTSQLPAMSKEGSPLEVVSGDTFFFKINGLLTATRGRSDYITIFDLADLYDQFIFSRADRSIIGNNVVHDITVENGSPTDCDEWAKKFSNIYPNRAVAHNEKIKYEIKNPNLRAEDASFDDRTICNYILGSWGFPEHFYGSGGSTNRATAMEMHEPVVRKLKTRQLMVKAMLHRQLDFVIYQARAAGYYKGKGAEYEIVFPEVSYKDMQRSGLTMMYLAQSLAIAVENQWITQMSAAEIYAKVASGFGPDIPPNPDAAQDFDQINKEKLEDKEGPDDGQDQDKQEKAVSEVIRLRQR